MQRDTRQVVTTRRTSPTRVIPYFTVPPLQLGPVDVQSFGILSALGVWLACWLLVRGARVRGLDERPVVGVATWALVGGLVGAHLMHLLLYHPEELRGPWNAWQLLKFWDGLSSTGGVLGGAAAVALYFRQRGLPFSHYSDVFALAVAPGWVVARLGCFSVHDHLGRLTTFPLAVAFPEGARHDLGLYDALLLAVISAILYVCARRGLLRGRFLPLLALLYGTGRFFLDFLRATDLPYVDARYFGLTPAQYMCIGFAVYGILGLRRARATRKSGAGEPQQPLNVIGA
jgi:phosphatidylglycerol:prolipoprotein diacylglycerol transferase